MNARNIIKGVAAVMLGIMGTACSHDELDTYSGPKSMIYIQQTNSTDQYGNILSYRNVSTLSFATTRPEILSGTYSFFVRVTGGPVDFPRTYKMAVDPEGTTAIEGEDYDLSRNDYTIHAGCVTDTFFVTIKRTDKLQKQEYAVCLHLEPNENFHIDIDHFKNSSSWSVDGPEMDATRYTFKFSEIYTCPRYWTNMNADTFFGPFSPKKYKILNSLMGWQASDWNYAGFSGYPVQYGKFGFAAEQLQKYLQKMSDAGTPEREEDGSFMKAGPNYPVDYSKYNQGGSNE